MDAQLAAMAPEARPQLRELLESIPFPDRTPAFSALILDDADRIWAAAFREDGVPRNEWFIVHASKKAPQVIQLPAEVELIATHPPYLVGLRVGPLGEESVERWVVEGLEDLPPA